MAVRRSSLLQEVAQQSQGTVRLTRLGSGWPADGEIALGSGSFPARFYVGPVGESHRGRVDERRFQNPNQDKPIELLDGALCVLWGVVEPEHEGGDPVIVAMDAYRRAGLTTRFSMFMPSSLLESASELGIAEHMTETGETLYAFKPSHISEYVTKLLNVRGAGLQWSEQDFGAPPTREKKRKEPQEAPSSDSIHIRPRVGMYAAFARLNYKPWYAIAEFIDNSVQSYLNHRTRLPSEVLTVEIRFDEDEIVIADNAAGIALQEFPRAFSPSQPPPNASGLSEFGLGMKAAACWFSRYWTVRTSALGDASERLVRFDIDRVTTEDIEHLPIEKRAAKAGDHFTVVTLRNLRVRPHGRTLGKIKEHLASMYRVLMEKGLVRIRVSSATTAEDLSYSREPLMTAPYFRDPDGPERLWRAELDVTLPEGRRVTGWAGLLERGSSSHAGFSVFRRDRLIQGSADETYRPMRIFRNPNSYTYQRLVGELFVDGFDVSHTKDGIQWGGYEEELLNRLRDQLSSSEMPMLAQAEGFRVRKTSRDLPESFGEEAVQGTVAELEAAVETLIAPLAEAEPVIADISVHPTPTAQRHEMTLSDGGESVHVSFDLIRDPKQPWYGFTHQPQEEGYALNIWLNLAHPFSESFVNGDENTLGPLVRIVTALCFSEHSAVLGGFPRVARMRTRVNELLRQFGEEEELKVMAS